MEPGNQDYCERIRLLHTAFLEEVGKLIQHLESRDFLLSWSLNGERDKIASTLPYMWYSNLKECLAEEEKFIRMQVNKYEGIQIH